jgi:5-methylcytosine-specific restriction endonuclease McrA
MEKMGYDEETKQRIWKKASVVKNEDSNVWRKDECGTLMEYSEYGNRGSQYGWEIDHITSKDHDGEDNLDNLRPLQWENNAAKGPDRLKCAVTNQDTKSINETLSKKIY